MLGRCLRLADSSLSEMMLFACFSKFPFIVIEARASTISFTESGVSFSISEKQESKVELPETKISGVQLIKVPCRG